MVSNHDHLPLTDLGLFEVAEFGNLREQAHIGPMRAIKDFLKLLGVNAWVGVDPKRNSTRLRAAPRSALMGWGGGVLIHDGLSSGKKSIKVMCVIKFAIKFAMRFSCFPKWPVNPVR